MMLNSDTCKTARLEGADRAPLCPLWSARCGDVVLVVYCARGGAAARPSPREQGGDSDQTNGHFALWSRYGVEWSGVDASGVWRCRVSDGPEAARRSPPRALPRRGRGSTGYRCTITTARHAARPDPTREPSIRSLRRISTAGPRGSRADRTRPRRADASD
jgi:hypothetical protein